MNKKHDSRQKERWRLYKQAYRKRNKTISVSIPKKEAKELETLAKDHNQALATYIKNIVRAHRQQNGYVLPDSDTLIRLERILRITANNINQCVRYTHIKKLIDQNDLRYLQKQIISMHESIEKALKMPENIEDVVSLYLSQQNRDTKSHNTKKEKLVRFIETHTFSKHDY